MAADQHTPFVGKYWSVGFCQDPSFDDILPGCNQDLFASSEDLAGIMDALRWK